MTVTTPGRPRDRGIDDAILSATWDVLTVQGYAGLTIGAVAGRAGTTKPAVYRRWAARQNLVIAALAARFDIAAQPESGCTRCDLLGVIEVYADAFGRDLPPRVLAPLIADCASDPQLYRRAMDALFLPLCAATRVILDRAAAHGDLRPDTDLNLVLDMLASMVHYRALYGHAPVTVALLVDVVDTLLQGIAADYPTLLATSLRHGHHPSHGRPPDAG